MGAIKQGKRKKTAREVAEHFNINPRTVRRIFAQPRAEFLAEADRRRKQALALKEQGLKYTEIAEKMEISIEAAKALLKRARAQERA
jgi:DNA-directed RNA polymerase specialized sigma24 family protein